MATFDGHEQCDCPVHGVVCARRTTAREGGNPDAMHFYECPGVEGDTGGCNEMLTPRGQVCDRPDWAEYPAEH